MMLTSIFNRFLGVVLVLATRGRCANPTTDHSATFIEKVSHLPQRYLPQRYYSYSVDLSGLTNLRGSSALATHLESLLEKATEEADEAASTSGPALSQSTDCFIDIDIQLDLSHSALRDSDWRKIVCILFPNDTNITSADFMADYPSMRPCRRRRINIQLTARYNQLTQVAATFLIQRILTRKFLSFNATQNTTTSAPASALSIHLDSSETAASSAIGYYDRELSLLDLGWNPLNNEAISGRSKNMKIAAFLNSLQKLIASRRRSSPTTIRFDRCGLGPSHGRAIAKGLMRRWGATMDDGSDEGIEDDDDFDENDCDNSIRHINSNSTVINVENVTAAVEQLERRRFTPRPLSLFLSGNAAFGDAGVAALAAALKTIAIATLVNDDPDSRLIFDTLDLSSCGIGDLGAEVLAVALESCATRGVQCVIRHLDLSNNRISTVGASALGRALMTQSLSLLTSTPLKKSPQVCTIHGLDLSDNKDVGDYGASAIAATVGAGRLPRAILRNCNVYADGAAAFGKALGHLVNLSRQQRNKDSVRKDADDYENIDVEVDLSGNPLGVLRGKKKDNSGKYSASHFKSKASATAASYMNHGMSFLKKNLKDAGVDVAPIFGAMSAESDDEEEMDSTGLGVLNEEFDPSKGRCGAKSLSNEFIDVVSRIETSKLTSSPSVKRVHLGLRHCFFDHGASDALAALKISARDKAGVQIDMDVCLNSILEEEMVEALHGSETQTNLLHEMAERHLVALEVLQEARERAAQSSAAVAAQVRAQMEEEKQYNFNWGEAPDGFGDVSIKEYSRWDSEDEDDK